jgi:hypothetical protein
VHRRRKWFALRQTENLDGTVTRRRYNAKSGTGDASGDRQVNETCRGGKDFGSSHSGNSSGSVMAMPLIQASAGRAYRQSPRPVWSLGCIVAGFYAVTRAPIGSNILRFGACPERLRAG